MDAGTERLFRPPPSALKRCWEKARKVREEGEFPSLSGFQQHLQETRGGPRDKERAGLPWSERPL